MLSPATFLLLLLPLSSGFTLPAFPPVSQLPAALALRPISCSPSYSPSALFLRSPAPPTPVHLLGTGSSSPSLRLPNAALPASLDTSDDWIRTRTGITARHLLPATADGTGAGETMAGLAADAARRALDMSGVPPAEIDLVINCCSSPDDLFGDATTVAAKAGCVNAVAFDLTAACSGFLFGLVTASNFLQGPARNVLVVGGDALSRWVDWEDRNS